MSNRITQEQKDSIHLMVDDGKSAKEIAEYLEINPATAGYHASRYRKSQEPKEETEEETQEDPSNAVADLYERMLTMKDDHIASLEKVIQMITGVKQ